MKRFISLVFVGLLGTITKANASPIQWNLDSHDLVEVRNAREFADFKAEHSVQLANFDIDPRRWVNGNPQSGGLLSISFLGDVYIASGTSCNFGDTRIQMFIPTSYSSVIQKGGSDGDTNTPSVFQELPPSPVSFPQTDPCAN